MKKKLKIIINLLAAIAAINFAVSNLTYNLKHPEKSEMRVFLHSPKSFIWDFK